MKRYVCRHCGFESLIDPGERCPGCGYLFSCLNHRPAWTQEALESAQEEIEIRRLRCAFMRQDEAKEGALMECTITNKAMRLRPCGLWKSGQAMRWDKIGQFPFEIVLPYSRLTKVTQGTHLGQRARFFTYHHAMLGALNLWFFMDRGAASCCGDIDRQVAQTVERFIHTGKEAACPGDP